MNLDSIYRRLLDVSIQLNQLMADIKEVNDCHSSGECMTTLELLQERRRAAMEQHCRDFEEQHDIHRDIHGYDEVDGQSHHEGS